jgi:hypothetical protein
MRLIRDWIELVFNFKSNKELDGIERRLRKEIGERLSGLNPCLFYQCNPIVNGTLKNGPPLHTTIIWRGEGGGDGCGKRVPPGSRLPATT